MTHFIASISAHLSRKRTADAFLQFLTNSSSIIIVFLHELSEAYENGGGSSTSPEETISRYLELFPDSNLANVLAEQQQRKKLKMASDDVLSNFLDPKLSSCYIVKDFFREICAGAVLEPTVTSLSRPEYINSWIVYLLREGEPEIMSAIDAGVEGARNQGVALPSTPSETIPPVSAGGGAAPDAQPSTKSKRDDSKIRAAADRETEYAVKETRRLSSMMIAQNTSKQDLRESTQPSDSGATTAQEQPSSADSRNGNGQNAGVSSTDTIPEENGTPEPRQSSEDQSTAPQPAPLTLHCASVSVDDGSGPEDTALIRAKPVEDYLIQIEPVLSHRSGWMVFRKYDDFEPLHETLSIVARINKIRSFSEDHDDLPPWRGQTKHGLTQKLERYLQDALQHESLAESMRMRRFLEKDERASAGPGGTMMKSGLQFPSQNAFENVGKSVLDALANAPKGMAGGSKAVFDGVSGVFGGQGVPAGKKTPEPEAAGSNKGDETPLVARDERLPSESGDSQSDAALPKLSSPSDHLGDSSDSYFTAISSSMNPRAATPGLSSDQSTRAHLSDAQTVQNAERSESAVDEEPGEPSSLTEVGEEVKIEPLATPSEAEGEVPVSSRTSEVDRRRNSSITRDETQIALELIFAVINELYASSSAWNIRRTILNAAKSYILRPGSPNLETIRELLQSSMIDAHTTDEALGGYLMNIRETVFPTGDYDYTPPSEAEKQRLRETARRLFVQKGMPQAVMSVMGTAASREALEKVFDCLQVDSVARGFVFSLLLQALKVVIL